MDDNSFSFEATSGTANGASRAEAAHTRAPSHDPQTHSRRPSYTLPASEGSIRTQARPDARPDARRLHTFAATTTTDSDVNLSRVPESAVSSPGDKADPDDFKPSDPKTPSEYALHILFTQFVRHAERKLNACLKDSREPLVQDVLGQGCDTEFDNIVESLGYIARRKPKPVIDSVMFWRKAKSEAAATAVAKLSAYLNANPAVVNGSGSSSTSRSRNGYYSRSGSSSATHSRNVSRTASHSHTDSDALEALDALRLQVFKTERKSLVSIFILCRVLMEVVKQTPSDVLGEDLSDKLEEIVFKQLRVADPELLAGSGVRHANWTLFAQLLGEMSTHRFDTVADRFIADLEKVPAVVPKDRDVGTRLVIYGMRHLRIHLYPMDRLDASAEFLESIGKFLGRSQTPSIQSAYADVVAQMLLPIGGHANAELNHPTWVKSVETFYDRALELCRSPKTWDKGFALAVAALCVAPHELFAKHWVQLCDQNLPKALKDRALRPPLYTAVAQLLWVYVCRCSDSLNSTTKKLDTLAKALLFNNVKKVWATPDPGVFTPTVFFIRVATHANPQYPLDSILMQMLHTGGGDDVTSLDVVMPERAGIAVTAFVHILKGGRPELDESSDTGFNYSSESSPGLGSGSHLGLGGSSGTKPKPTLPTPGWRKGQGKALTEFYDRFSRAVMRIATLLDAQYGAQAPDIAPLKAPKAVGFHFGADTSTAALRPHYQELFRIVLSSIPWLQDSGAQPLTRAVELLFRNLNHPVQTIAQIAASALTSLAEIQDVRTVVLAYAKLLFSVEEAMYSSYTTALEAPNDFERLLRLYVTMLEVWVQRIKGDQDKTETNEIDESMLNNWWSAVEEVEGNGLYFLCSHHLPVRQLAVRILKLCVDFDGAIEKYRATRSSKHARTVSKAADKLEPVADAVTEGETESSDQAEPSSPTRIITFLRNSSISQLLSLSPIRVVLSQPEVDRLGDLRQRSKDTLVRVCESESGVDTALWLRVFALFLNECFEKHPIPTALARSLICVRLVGTHEVVLEHGRRENALQGVSSNSGYGIGPGFGAHPMRTHPEVVVEQWRLYLTAVCCTLTVTDEQKVHVPDASAGPQHGRKKSSTQKITLHHQRITSIKTVFRLVLPLLSLDVAVIRDAVVSALGWVNVNVYKTLLQALLGESNYSNPRVLVETAHILRATAHFLDHKDIGTDEWVVGQLLQFLVKTRAVLARPEVQTDWAYQRLRRYICGLVERLYVGVQSSSTSHLIPADFRVKWFTMVEEWAPLGKHQALARDRESIMRQHALARAKDVERSLVLASMEFERKASELAIVSCLAGLSLNSSKDPDRDHTSRTPGSTSSILALVSCLLNDHRPELRELGRTALHNLLSTPDPAVVAQVVDCCYKTHAQTSAGRDYFLTLAQLVNASEGALKLDLVQGLALALVKTGDVDVVVRVTAVKTLKTIEKAAYGGSCAADFEASVTSRSPALHKRALYSLSARLALDHADEGFRVFSEVTRVLNLVSESSRRDVLVVLLPWVQSLVLTADPADSDMPGPAGCMVLANLLAITAEFSATLQGEVEALWVALASVNASSTTHNSRLVLSFLFRHTMATRDPTLLRHARDIMDCLGTTAAAPALVDVLLTYLSPTSMIPHVPDALDFELAKSSFAYVADISAGVGPDSVSNSSSLSPLSFGQIAMVLLQDLVLMMPDMVHGHLARILQVVLVLYDHFVPIVSDQARDLLVVLIRQFAPGDRLASRISSKEQSLCWTYEGLSGKDGANTPQAMAVLVDGLLKLAPEPGLAQDWSRVALIWATSCPVRHIACRSFQLFRCLLCVMDQAMLADMLARLSSTLSDTKPEIQGFTIQILMTLNAVAGELDAERLIDFPQFFWAVVASLGSANEAEFLESLSVLDKFLAKIDLDSPASVECLRSTFPQGWDGEFLGLQKAVLVGLRSATAWAPTLKVLDKLNQLQSSAIVAGPDRLALAITANIPRYLHAFEQGLTPDVEESLETLEKMCELEQGSGSSLGRILQSLRKQRFRSKPDLISQLVNALTTAFFPRYQSPVLLFLLGLLSNKLPWVKLEIMELLVKIFPAVDLASPEFQGVGADLISPLLRLLQTQYSEPALAALDSAAVISSSKRDRQVLRMSLGNRAIRKEYERTATLFGLPEESGWAVPMPGAATSMARANVHAVFYTCAVSQGVDLGKSKEDLSADADVEFLEDMQRHYGGGQGQSLNQSQSHQYGEYTQYQYGQPYEDVQPYRSYGQPYEDQYQHQYPNQHQYVGQNQYPDQFQNPAHAQYLGQHHNHSQGQYPEQNDQGSLSRMWNTLDDLDSFFTRDNAVPGRHNHTVSDDARTDTTIEPVESAPQLYDKNVALILNRSLARTPSVTSFKTSLADSFGAGLPSSRGLRSQPVQRSRLAEVNDDDQEDDDDDDSDDDILARMGASSQALTPVDSESGAKLPKSPLYQSLMASPEHSNRLATDVSTSTTRHPVPAESSFRLDGLLRGNIRRKKSKPILEAAVAQVDLDAAIAELDDKHRRSPQDARRLFQFPPGR